MEQYIRDWELFILCYMYNTMAFRLLHGSESFSARISAATLSLSFIYFTFFIVVAYVFQNTPWFDCYGEVFKASNYSHFDIN